jgi:hypothetical protein
MHASGCELECCLLLLQPGPEQNFVRTLSESPGCVVTGRVLSKHGLAQNLATAPRRFGALPACPSRSALWHLANSAAGRLILAAAGGGRGLFGVEPDALGSNLNNLSDAGLDSHVNT